MFESEYDIDHYPTCEYCGDPLDYERCDQCEDGYSGHDCGEDCCACLNPEPNEVCDQCEGEGGWYQCWNSTCPGKQTSSRTPQEARRAI